LKPEYQVFAGWNRTITDKTSFQELPPELIAYIKYIEDSGGLPVDMVSVGPDRVQTIRKTPL